MFQLTNRTVLLTGSTGGIGQSIAEVLVEAGANIILTGTNMKVLEEMTSKLCSKRSDSAKFLQCSLKDPKAADSLFDKAEELAGNIDLLVCNAGICRDNLSIRMKEEEWDEVLHLNLTATF